ncbi:MAG: shikimate dehydrogenase [Chthoniobacterales bacterium]
MKEFYTLADLEDWSEPRIRLGVVGDPVRQSRSPAMINAALQACGLEMEYARFQISADELATAVQLFVRQNFLGLNFTIPHKISAAALADELDDGARSAGAINIVRIEDGKLFGSNTDGPGFSRAIRQEFAVDLRDLRVLLLGAGGGAGRAIAAQCAREGCERLVLVNRTAAKAHELAEKLRPQFQEARVLGPVPRLEVVEWKEAALRAQIANVDLVVNASSLGWKHSDPAPLTASSLAPHLMIYDTVYRTERTPLLAAAAEAGARGANGLEMLLQQGALAFEKWFERAAPIDVMRAALR